jgi:hypothetical protein
VCAAGPASAGVEEAAGVKDAAVTASAGNPGRALSGGAPACAAGPAAAGVVEALAVAASGVLASAVAAVLVRARGVAGFAWGSAAALPGRGEGGFFARVPGVAPDREVAGVVFGPAAAPASVGRVPAAASPEAVAAGPVLSVGAGLVSDPVASALPRSRSAEASAALDRLAARVWLSVPAGCLLAARLGAGSVPCPAELSPGIPFSEVTAP